MSRKQDKTAKRKAKLKAKRVHEENLRLQFNSRIANAIVDLCAEDLPDYVDDSKGIDLSGRLIIWQIGMIAWNIAVTGRREIGENAISKMRLDEGSQKIVRDEINKLVRLKYRMRRQRFWASSEDWKRNDDGRIHSRTLTWKTTAQKETA